MATTRTNSTGKTAAKSKTARKAPAARAAGVKAKAAPRARETAAKAATLVAPTPALTPEQRYLMVQEAAYHNAEREGFRGDPMIHWLAAERQIREQLGE